jgi:hypothetical protein
MCIIMEIVLGAPFTHQVPFMIIMQIFSIRLSSVIFITIVLFTILSMIVVYSTKDLEKMTVAQITKT